jgi:hypothetical protein
MSVSHSETLLAQVEKLLSGIAGGVASTIVRRRFPSRAVRTNWVQRLRRAADMLEKYDEN